MILKAFWGPFAHLSFCRGPCRILTYGSGSDYSFHWWSSLNYSDPGRVLCEIAITHCIRRFKPYFPDFGIFAECCNTLIKPFLHNASTIRTLRYPITFHSFSRPQRGSVVSKLFGQKILLLRKANLKTCLPCNHNIAGISIHSFSIFVSFKFDCSIQCNQMFCTILCLTWQRKFS